MNKIDIVLEAYGYTDTNALIEEYMMAGTVPGICQSETCNNIEEYEPDQRNGHCNECGKKSVKSVIEMLLF